MSANKLQLHHPIHHPPGVPHSACMCCCPAAPVATRQQLHAAVAHVDIQQGDPGSHLHNQHTKQGSTAACVLCEINDVWQRCSSSLGLSQPAVLETCFEFVAVVCAHHPPHLQSAPAIWVAVGVVLVPRHIGCLLPAACERYRASGSSHIVYSCGPGWHLQLLTRLC
jgi:hypothetical protein